MRKRQTGVPPTACREDLSSENQRFGKRLPYRAGMTVPSSERTAELVRGLLVGQHPDLAGLAIREMPGGWDNKMWRLGNELVVRMSRTGTRTRSPSGERRWLPVLAPRLPLPVPIPGRTGEPSALFPKLWTIMTWVPGTPLDCTSISRSEQSPSSTRNRAPVLTPDARHSGQRLESALRPGSAPTTLELPK